MLGKAQMYLAFHSPYITFVRYYDTTFLPLTIPRSARSQHMRLYSYPFLLDVGWHHDNHYAYRCRPGSV